TLALGPDFKRSRINPVVKGCVVSLAVLKVMKILNKIIVLTGLLLLGSAPAHAMDFSDISENIVNSIANVPGLVTGLSYMLALIFGALGVLKLKQHVEDPRQATLKDSVVRFAAGGALFALPIVFDAMRTSIDGGAGGAFGGGG